MNWANLILTMSIPHGTNIIMFLEIRERTKYLVPEVCGNNEYVLNISLLHIPCEKLHMYIHLI